LKNLDWIIRSGDRRVRLSDWTGLKIHFFWKTI
jgi:hypothetical protein